MNKRLTNQLLQKINLEKIENKISSIEKRKTRNHNLIVKGTVFERLGLLDESEEFLLGLLISTKYYKITDKKPYEDLGEKFLEKRGNYKKKKEVKDNE